MFFFFLHLVLQQEIIHFMNYNNLQLILLSGWFHHLTPFSPSIRSLTAPSFKTAEQATGAMCESDHLPQIPFW